MEHQVPLHIIGLFRGALVVFRVCYGKSRECVTALEFEYLFSGHFIFKFRCLNSLDQEQQRNGYIILTCEKKMCFK